MRLNLPVSNIEFVLPDGVVIVSKTDLKGVITYCNRAFTEVSGYGREELIGSAHNMVRHPDMPPEVFADLWRTIKAGRPWQGVVKNRRKDGSFYWAVSNVTPLLEKGRTVGYVAFRYKATREQVETASNAYREIREGTRRLRIEEGSIVELKSPLLHRLSRVTVKARLFALIFLLLGTMVVAGIYNLRAAAEAHDRTVNSLAEASIHAYALDTARSAESAFKEQRRAWKNILIRGQDQALLKQYLEEFDRHGEEVERILVGQLEPIMQQIGMPTAEVEALLELQALLYHRYHSILESGGYRLESLRTVDTQSGEFDQRVAEQFGVVISSIRDAQLHGLGDLNDLLDRSYQSRRGSSIGMLIGFALGGLLLSGWIIVGVLRPIRRTSSDLDRVVQLQQQFLGKILALEESSDRLDEEQRIGSYIMGHITNVHGTLDPLIRHLIRPAEHLSGDMLLAARTPDDVLHILLADAVGHGLVAAVNVLPLSQAFYDMTGDGFRIAQIAEDLNLKIHRFMPVDRFVAVTLVSIDARNHIVEVWNGGNPAPVLIGRRGEILREWKSAHPPLGILAEESFSGRPEVFQYEDNCQLCLFSDGLSEAESPLGEPFGRERIDNALRYAGSADRFDALVKTLEAHLAERRAHDDITLALVEVPVYQQSEMVPAAQAPVRTIAEGRGDWRIAISLGAAELKYLNIVPMLTGIIEKIQVANEFAAPLFMILSELFNNALDHGILRLDSRIKHGADGFDKFLELREERLHALEEGRIDLEIEKVAIDGRYGVKIRVADSGPGFDYAAILAEAENRLKLGQHGRGIALVESMAHRLEFASGGCEVTAYYVCT